MSPKVTPRPTREAALRLLDRATTAEDREQAKKIARVLDHITPYGPDSEHSWVLDSARTCDGQVVQRETRERLERHRASVETRAVTSTTLGGLIPATIPPYVAEAVAYGVRSTAPLAAALLRLDLPPVGMSVAWAKVTTAATVGNQSAENTAVAASADLAVGSATDPLGTVAGHLDFSAQSLDLSGGWFDRVAGEELGRAFGARLEQQIWAGTGANQQLKGFTVMTGNSASTVSGQTMPLFMNKVYDQFQQVTNNLGEAPDIIALAPRRYAMLGAAAAAFGLDATDLLPDELTTVVSPAAPLTLGGGTEDWAVLINRAAVPLVSDPEPTTVMHIRQQAGTSLQLQWVVYAYAALGVNRRPEGVGLVKGATTPTFT